MKKYDSFSHTFQDFVFILLLQVDYYTLIDQYI